MLGAALVWSLWRARRTGAVRWWLPALAATVAMALVPALVIPFKALVDRPGPPGPLASESGFFPSGHTATAAVAYGAAALLLCPHPGQGQGQGQGRRRALFAAVTLLNAGVGVGLVRCAYHWPLDVVAGWCLTGALLWTVARLSRADGTATGPEPGGSPTAPRPRTGP